MPHAIRIHETGGPERLLWEEVDTPVPGPGQVLIRNGAIGLNFVDTYFRSGQYPLPLPLTCGLEGAGTVLTVGEGVEEFRPGDRVAYVDPLGAYAELLVRPVSRLVKLPDAVSEEAAAAMMLKGLTAKYLLHDTYQVKAGDTILVHAAAGGVGQILCQWARHLGATVIGTVGSDAKAAIARQAGCGHVIISGRENVPARVREISGGAGVPVVYDGLGQASFADSLDCLQPRGLLVSYGSASGPVAPFDINLLAQKGSLYLTRPNLGPYNKQRAQLLANAAVLFAAVESGAVSIPVGRRYPLREAAQAHRDLEARRTTGSTVLLP